MLILDFYVDEPACFGVPPYLSPYCRYVAGAWVSGGHSQNDVHYLTVDQWRAHNKELPLDDELLVLIAGSTVPGKYLGGKIGTVSEIFEVLAYRKKFHKNSVTLVGGPIRYVSADIRNQIHDLGGVLIRGDIEAYVAQLSSDKGHLKNTIEEKGFSNGKNTGQRRKYTGQVDDWAVAGAFLIQKHPNYPNMILEIETYRGCTRSVFCSFCTEAYYGKPEFRSVAAIENEVRELSTHQAHYFRLGRQADIMTFLPDMQDFQKGFPRPIPHNLLLLYEAMHRAAPNLRMLHLDNINPGLIAAFPAESRQIIKIICDHNTPGDTAAMGIESVDDNVIKQNDLKCNAEEAMLAIEIVNEYGAVRQNGIPKLLPGLNFISGLPGESKDTFKKNYEFLKGIVEAGLLLRRINIRQVVQFENTKLDQLNAGQHRKHKAHGTLENRFRFYKDKIRKEIDLPMLDQNFPPGTIISDVILEQRNQGNFLGRPLGSYPVTIKIPDDDALAARNYLGDENNIRQPMDVVITGSNERSLTGLCAPVHINLLGIKALRSIPGIGQKRALHIHALLPVGSAAELYDVLDDRSILNSAACVYS